MSDTLDHYIKESLRTSAADWLTWGNEAGRIEFDAYHPNLYMKLCCMYGDYDDDGSEDWSNFKGNILDTLEAIQVPVIKYMMKHYGDARSHHLDGMIEENRDWKYWFSQYARSEELWIDHDHLKDECWKTIYYKCIINLQSNIRRRQATIRVIRKLHLTGSLH